jgi:hypothetical protein
MSQDQKSVSPGKRSRLYWRLLPGLVGLAFVLSTTPLFFAYYREAAFHTHPFDDYAPSLLALVGERGEPPARLPTLLQRAPMGYRVLSVVAAIPFYYVLPYYSFSRLQEPDELYLRATAALSMVSYLSVLLTVLVIYAIARRKLQRSLGASLLAALLSFGLFQFLGTSSVDPLALLVISLLVYFVDRPAVFAPLIVVSAAMNEKVAIVFAVVFAARFFAWLLRRRGRFQYWTQAFATGIAVVAYVAMRLTLRLPGYESQTDPGTWLSGAASTLAASLSLKGFVQNGIPLVIMAILALVAFVVWQRRPSIWHFSPLDLAVAPALMIIGFAIDMQFTVGRLVMHSFPLYLPLLAHFIEDHVIGRSIGPASAAHEEGGAPIGS